MQGHFTVRYHLLDRLHVNFTQVFNLMMILSRILLLSDLLFLVVASLLLFHLFWLLLKDLLSLFIEEFACDQSLKWILINFR